MVSLRLETSGGRRRLLRRSGDRFSPQAVLELGGAFAQCCKSLRKLRLTIRLDTQVYILSKQLHNVGSVRLRQQLRPARSRADRVCLFNQKFAARLVPGGSDGETESKQQPQ